MSKRSSPTFRADREMEHVPGFSRPTTCGCTQRQLPSEHDQEFLAAVMKVVNNSATARKLVRVAPRSLPSATGRFRPSAWSSLHSFDQTFTRPILSFAASDAEATTSRVIGPSSGGGSTPWRIAFADRRIAGDDGTPVDDESSVTVEHSCHREHVGNRLSIEPVGVQRARTHDSGLAARTLQQLLTPS
jgi:hypothetical protein